MTLFSSAKEFHSLYKDIALKADSLRLQAKGGSMYPFIHSGDWVNVAPVKPDSEGEIRKGDIVLFKRNDNLYIHRVIRTEKDHLISKGDLSFGTDGVIDKKDVLAKVVSVEHRGRIVDLSSTRSLFLGSLVVNAGTLLQYPILAARKILGLGAAGLWAIQTLKAYRLLAKKVLKPKVTVRSARPEDEEAMRDLYLMNGVDIKEGIAKIEEEGFWLVAEMNNKIVGGLTVTRYEKDKRIWVIFGLEVKPALRGLGIGRKMAREAIVKARESGARQIGLFVKKKGLPALGLYRKLGFKETEDFPARFNRSADELYLSYNIGWNGITLEKAEKEGVFYPFYRWLIETGQECIVPENHREKYKQIYYLHLSGSAELSEQVERTLDLIDKLNIKTLLFKGPAIDSLIYDGFFRPRLDLDIVIRDEDMPRVEMALAEFGYLSAPEEKDCIHPAQLTSKVFTHKDNALMPLHIHRHLINNTFLTADRSLRMDMKEVWRETEAFKNYRNILILKPELNIIYLSEHGLKHDFDQLVFLYEIERLITYYKERFDWKKLLALAKRFGMERLVYHGLYFTKERLSGDIPNEVIDAVKPKRFSAGEKAFIKNTLNNKQGRYSSYSVYLAARVGLLKKINFLLCTAFPPRFTLKDHLGRIRRSVLR